MTPLNRYVSVGQSVGSLTSTLDRVQSDRFNLIKQRFIAETDRTGHLVKTIQPTGETIKPEVSTVTGEHDSLNDRSIDSLFTCWPSTESTEDLQTDKQVANGNNGATKSKLSFFFWLFNQYELLDFIMKY